MMRHLLLCLSILCFLGISSCSKDEKPGDSFTGDLGEVSLTVSGDVVGKFKGMADFELDKYSNTYIFDISMHDFNPQTFSLSIQKVHTDEDNIEIPGPGTYTIGTFSDADYQAEFIPIVDEDFVNTTEYITAFSDEKDTSGELTIHSSDGKTLKGNFEFTAHELDDEFNPVGSVTVVGEFTANKRIY